MRSIILLPLALALAGALAFSHFYVYRSGKANVQNKWKIAVAQANTEARALENRRQDRVVEAGALAAKRTRALAAAARAARAQHDGLRSDLDATRLYAAKSSAAAAKSVATLADVFEQCTKRYIEMAEIAAGHASDSLNYQEGWPK